MRIEFNEDVQPPKLGDGVVFSTGQFEDKYLIILNNGYQLLNLGTSTTGDSFSSPTVLINSLKEEAINGEYTLRVIPSERLKLSILND